ncbi:hypothetical protein ACFWOT_37125 [Streptomyces sp. NPDC058440]|uniref:hypothetical protein n=1 Tax=Streptomyces sp. NPDC058440 TaxID=3346501 RepID=UPI00364D2EEE
MTLQEAAALVSAGTGIVTLLDAAVRAPRVAALLDRLRRYRSAMGRAAEVLEATSEEAPRPVPALSPGAVAAALFAQLPPGAVARYEMPDGSALTVWWIMPPLNGRGNEDYRLW